jgi:hypothetical protein
LDCPRCPVSGPIKDDNGRARFGNVPGNGQRKILINLRRIAPGILRHAASADSNKVFAWNRDKPVDSFDIVHTVKTGGARD